MDSQEQRAPGRAPRDGVDASQRRALLHPAALWGVFGFCALLAQAVVRLTPLALEPVQAGTLTSVHWVLYIGCLAFMGYTEGYRGFQRAVAPRVVARAVALGEQPTLLRGLLAPAFCMALFHAPARRVLTSWLVYAGIVVMVVLVRQIPQPLRGIIDAGVVFGLAWGIVSIALLWLRTIAGKSLYASPELPEAAG